jgi:Ca2+-binding RTX toxin-like protein
MSNFTLTAGIDTFSGTAGELNTFFFIPANLQSTDSITGGATGGFIDVLSVTAAGIIAASQFAGATNVEELDLSASGNSVTLTNGLVAGSSVGYFSVIESGGDNSVDASSLTTTVAFQAASGADTLAGGSGNDVFFFAPSDLTASDFISGGGGFDYIQFTQAGTIAGSAFTNVSHVEAVVLAGAGDGTLTLTDQLVNSSDTGQFTATSLGSGTHVVDASGVSSTRTIIFYAGTGIDTLQGGAGNDSFVFTSADDLTAIDAVRGGTGVDSILFVNGGTVAATAFADVLGIEALTLSTGGNNVTLTNNLVAGSSIGAFAVAAQAGSNTADASGVTNNTNIIFIAGSGADTFQGGTGSDGYVFSAANLTSADIVQGGSGTDAIYLTTGGTVAASAFDNVTGVETLVLTGGDSNVTLNNASAATSSVGAFFVVDNAASNTVDASGFTTAAVSIIAGSGSDTFKGGAGNDVFSFRAADLTSADTVIAGGGADTLVISDNGIVTIAKSSGVSQIEAVLLAAGGEFDFANSLANSTVFASGTAAVDKFDGTAVTDYALAIFGNGGADTLIGGAKDDTITIPDSNFASVDGRAGNDTVTIAGSQTFDLGLVASKMHNVEVFKLDNTATNAVDFSVRGADVLAVSANNTLYVVGGINDQVHLGSGFALVGSGITNNSIASTVGYTFNHFHDANGADLYVADQIVLGTTALGGHPPNATPVTLTPIAEDSGAHTITAAQLLVGVSDPDGDATTITSLSIQSGLGTLIQVNATTWSYTPASNDDTSVTFAYTASDGTASSSSTASLDITPVNDAPVAHPVTLTAIGEDSGAHTITAAQLLTGVTDVDGPTPTITSFTIQFGLGTLVQQNATTWSYTPASNDDTSVTFAYTASDGSLSSSSTASLDITPVNDAPVAHPVTLTAIAEDSGAHTITAAQILTGVTDVDGPTATITSFSIQSGLGTLVQQNATTWSYTPASNDDTSVTFAYTASDGSLSSSSTASLDITPVNDAPVAHPVTLTAIAEDSGARTITAAELLTGVTDVDGPTATITSVSIQSGLGTLVQQNATTWSYTPASNDDTAVTFAYTASDGSLSASSTASLDITPVNDAPVAHPVTLTAIAEDSGARSITAAELLTGVTDVDGPTATITSVSIQSGLGTLVQQNATTWSYTPASNDDTAVTFAYTASDGSLSSSSTASLDITPVNDAPVAHPVTLTVIAEDSGARTITAAELLTGVTDVDGPTATVTSFTIQSGLGTLVQQNATTWSYTPASNDDTSVTFAYTASDGSLSSSSTASLDITPVNDVPAASPVTLTAIAEDSGARTITAAELLTGVTDVDGPTPTITSFTIQSGLGTLVQQNATTWSYTPASNDETSVTFAYTASDGSLSSSSTASLDITPVNDGPVANPVTLTAIAEDSGVRVITSAEILAGVTDVDGPTPTISSFAIQSGLGTLTQINATTWSYTPASNDDTSVTFAYTASDGSLSSSSTATLDITPVNDAPAGTAPAAISVDEDTPFAFTGGNALSVADVDSNVGVTLSVNHGVLNLTGAGVHGSGTGTVTIDSNSPLSVSGILAGLSYQGSANFSGSDTLTMVTSDGSLTDTDSVAITVNAVNDLPVAVADSTSTNEDNSVTYNVLVNDSDGDGDSLSVTSATVQGGAPVGTAVINPDRTITFTPAANVNGPVVIDYSIADGHGGTASSTLSINVNPVNDAPVSVGDSFTTDEDTQLTAFSVLANDSDVDGSFPLTVSRINGTAIAVNGTVGVTGGAVSLNADQTLTFTPNSNFNGDLAFLYTAKDGSGAESAQATVSIHVNAVNDAPVAAPNSFTTAEDTPTTFNVLANDSDVESGKPNFVSQVNGQAIVSGGTVSVTGGVVKLNSDQTLTFTPSADFNGTGLSFTYVAKDFAGGLESNAATVNYSVTAVNDAPVTTPDVVNGTEDTPVTFDVRTNDTDIDGPSPLQVTQINGMAISVGSPVTTPDGAQVALNADGTLTYTPFANANGSRSFGYTVSDGSASSFGNVTVNLAAVNDAPVANDNGSLGSPIAVVEDTATGINVLANDTDVDGPGPLAIASINGTTITTNGQTVAVAGGTVSVNTANGSLTFNPTANSNGPTQFTYVAKDGLGATSNSATVYLNVTPVNDAPAPSADTFNVNENGAASVGNVINVNNGNGVDSDVETIAANLTVNGIRLPGATSFTAVPAGGSTTLTFTNGAQVTVDSAGNVTLSQNGAFESLASGQQDELSFQYRLLDTGDPAGSGTGPGAPATANANVRIVISGQNDAPTTAANTVTTTEDTSYTFKLSDFPFADADSGDSLKAVQITAVPNGATGVVKLDGVAISANDVFTAAQISGGHLTFVPAADFNGSGALSFAVEDQSNAFSSPATLTLSVSAVNDAPVNTAPATVTATEDTSFAFSGGNAITVADVDSNVSVTLSVDHGVLTATGAGITGSGSNTLTINSATPAAVNTILSTLQYQGDLNFNGNDTLKVVTSDGSLSDTDIVAITVNAVNDNPVVDLNGASPGIDRSDLPTYTSGAAAIDVATAVATVTDVDNAISKITLHLAADSGTTDGAGTEGLSLPPGGSSFLTSIGFTVTGEGTDNLEITANAPGGVSPSVFEGILKTVLYHDSDTSFGFNPQDRSIAVTATDAAGGVSAAALVHIDLAANVTDLNGAGQLDQFVGANLADAIRGNAGDDTMEGRGGNDIIWGGTESGDVGHDTAVFTGNRADYTVTRTGTGVYTVADSVGGRDGTDTVHDIETLHFNGDATDLLLDAPILVFDASDSVLLATFQANQLDLAVDYANGHAGANVIELRSSASPFGAASWPVEISEAVTIKAVGGSATVNAGGNSAFQIDPGAVLGSTDTVRLEGLNITGNGTTGDTYGVVFNGAYEGPSDGRIELVGTSVSGFGSDGVAIGGGGGGLTVTVNGGTFTGSGYSSTSGGAGDILFFEFTGAAALSNLAVVGTTGTSASAADYGVQFAGFDGADHSVDHAIGQVSFDNVAVSGTYEKSLVYLQGYNDYSSLSFADGLALGGAGSAATWTALFIDGGPQGGVYVSGGTSTLDLTGVTVNGGTYGTSPSFAALGSKPIVVNGVLSGDVITGTNAAEAFIGSTGDDVIHAGGGNDLVLYNLGDGHDTVDGEIGADTLGLINFTSGAPSATSASFSVAGTAGHLIVNTDGAGPAEVDAVGMESVQLQLGNGGDAVTLTGDIAGAGVATGAGGIAISGGTGGDTVDASGLTSASAITFTNLNTGDDTFKAANVVANDQVDGGSGLETLGDTADYSAASATVTIDLAAGTASGTSVGSDSITHFENAKGGAGDDSISGTIGANTLSGGGGNDTLTGKGGNDAIHGNAGNDTAHFDGAYGSAVIAWNGTTATVTTAPDGTDTIDGVGKLTFAADSKTVWLVGSSSDYATVSQLFDGNAANGEAANGDVILLASGETFSEDVTVNKSVTVLGAANHGTAGTAALRGAESVLTGHWIVTAAGTVIDGVKFLNNAPYVSGSNDTRLTLAAGATVENSIFYNTRSGGDKPISDIAVNVTATSGAVAITGNYFTGDSHGKYFASGNSSVNDFVGAASWGGGSTALGSAGAIVWGGGSTLEVNHNTIQYARSALTVAGDDSLLSVDHNIIDTSGTGITATGWQGVVSGITNNTFTNVDNEINDRFEANGVNIDLGSNTSDVNFSFFAGRGDDTISGTAGADSIITNQGNDTVHAGAGDDLIFINAGTGNDLVDGGAHSGKDTLIVSNVQISGGSGNDLNPGDVNDPATATSGNPSNTAVTFTMTPTGDVVTPAGGVNHTSDILVTMATTAGASPLGQVTADEIEDVRFNLGNGGDTVNISGDFSATSLSPSTITVTGGNGADTVDARNLTSADHIVFNGGAGNDTFDYAVGTGVDSFDGGANNDTLNVFGNDGGSDTIHVTVNGSGAITAIEGMSPANVETYNADGRAGSDTLDYSASGSNAINVNLATGNATGFASITSIENAIGTSGADTFTAALSGVNTFTGGGGDDTYNLKAGDHAVEGNGNAGGIDAVFTKDSFTLEANVENLTLVENSVSNTQSFDGMSLGPITNGENGSNASDTAGTNGLGWKVAGSHDQQIVDRGGGNFAFRMSSDPTNGDFSGPYSPELIAAAGEAGAGAAFNGQSIRFDFQAVHASPDGSRLEVDFGNAAGTDRNNFLVIESFASTGIRITVSEPVSPAVVPGGSGFSGNGTDPAPNDWRELVTGVDPAAQHTLEMRLAYVDGQNNDRIDIYLDGQYIGQTTTFENYHDSLGGSHNANAAANFTDRVFFRGGANGSPQDGPGGSLDAGFYFDNLTTSVYNNTTGTGNALANVITGNSGDNLLTGLGGDDTLAGGLGIDTAVYQDARANYAIGVSSDAHGLVTGFSQVQETGAPGLVAEGTDTLGSIERLQFSDVRLDVNQKVQLFDSTDHLVGTFDHIQDAIDAGADGYRIRLAAGSYDESVNIDKNIEIDGANAGTPGADPRGAESIIRGQITVSAAHSATNRVTINGVEVYNTSDNTHPFVGIQVNSAADLTVTDSVFFSPVINGSNTIVDRAILLTTAATGTVNVDHNLFTGAAHSAFGSASWTTAIWSDGREAAGSSIDHNTFEWVRTGINADDFNNGLAIANNTFQNTGSGISIGGSGGGVNADVANITSIAHNTFNNVGDDFNLQNITAAGKPIGLDLTATDNHAVSPIDPVTVLGGASGDTLKGSAGIDILTGNGGNDTLAGGVGDDNIQGGAGTGDIAVYDNARGNYMIDVTTTNNIVTSFDGVTESTVVGVNEGHDTLTGIEILQFSGTTLNLNQAVQLFNNAGKLIGTFDHIQDAVTAADSSGETIRVKNGTYTEQVTVGAGKDGLSIIGESKAGVIIKAPAVIGVTGTAQHFGDAVRANVTVSGVTGVTIQNLTVDGNFAGDTTPGSNGDEISGIAYLHASGTVDSVIVKNVSNSATPALFGLQHGDGILVDNGTGAQQSITISNSQVNDFQKTGILIWNANVTVQGNDVEGIGPTSLTAQNAMQIGGSQGMIGGAGALSNTFGGVGYTLGNTTSTDLIVYEPSGPLSIINNLLNGSGGNTVGIDLTDVASGTLVTIQGNTIGTGGMVDGIDAYTFVPAEGLDSNPLISGNTFVGITGNGIFFDPEFVALGGSFTTTTVFNQTGSQVSDYLHGSRGADTLSSAGGNDTLAWNANDGNDTLSGGNNGTPHDDIDTLAVAARGHDLTLTAGSGNFTVSQDDDVVNNTTTVSEVEEVDITLSGGETITITGDFTGTGIAQHTITVDGSAGTTGETVDTAALGSGYPVDIKFTGGSGSDTLVVGNGTHLDFDGGGNTSGDGDTIDFSNVTTGIVIDSSGQVSGGATGTTADIENIVGTAATDRVEFGAGYTVTINNDGSATVTDGTITEHLSGIEQIKVGGKTYDLSQHVRLFDSGDNLIGTFDHIQDAINAADDPNETIRVANGNYAENLVINSSRAGLQIIGASATGAKLIGTGLGPDGIKVQADNVTLTNLDIEHYGVGIRIDANIADLTLDTVTSSNHGDPLHAELESAGLWVNGDKSVHGLTVIDSHFDSSSYGMYFQNFQGSGSTVTDVDVSHTSFSHNFIKGLYAEKLNEASFDEVDVIDSGNATTHNAVFANASSTQAGFDLNLKFGNYSNISITNSLFQDSGRYLEPLNGHDLAGALLVKARDDGGTYSLAPATLSGVTITGNTFENTNTPAKVTETDVGIRIGETGAVSLTGHPVTSVAISGNTFVDIDAPVTNTTNLALDLADVQADNFITGTTDNVDQTGVKELGNDLIVGGDLTDNVLSGGTGNDRIDGGDGDDTLTGGAGTDTLLGGLGTDKADYSVETGTAAIAVNLSATDFNLLAASHATDTFGATDTLSGIENVSANVARYGDTVALDGDPEDWTIAFDTDHWTVTGITPVFTDGQSYKLEGVEKIVFQCSGPLSAETMHLVDPGHAGSAYVSAQDAINHAAAGDIILLAAGTYNENLTTDKALTILGANYGLSGTDLGRGDESIINWTTGNAVTVNTTAQVSFHGLKFTGTHVLVETNPDANIAFADSVFVLTSAGGANNNFYLNQPDSFFFTDNKLDATGYTGALFQPVGTAGDASQTYVSFTGNTFTGHAATYVPGDDNNVPLIINLSDVNGEVSDNVFSNVDIGVLVANGSGPLDITGNTFEHMHRAPGTSGGGFGAGVVFFQPEFSDLVNVSNNSFTDADAGVRTSAVSGTTVDGSPIAIDGNSFSDVDHIGYQPVGGVLHFTDSTLDPLGPTPTTVPSEFFGGTSNDTITSTAADDIIHGNSGIDTVTFTGNADAATVNWDGTIATVTVTDGGTDTLDGVGVLQFADHKVFLVGTGSDYTTIQSAIDAASAGDTVFVANGTYNANVALKNGVNLVGASEAGVIINGTVSTPASFDNTTVSDLTVHNVGNGMLLDMTGTTEVTSSVFDHVAFGLSGDFTGAQAIGNGQVSGTMALNGTGLAFQHVAMASNNHLSGATAFVYTLMQTTGTAKLVLDDVTLSGHDSSGLGAQWNMSPQDSISQHAAVELTNSHTLGGGNYYVSGFDSVDVENNMFDGQGIALNGVKNATVTGNTFQNIDGTITANGSMHRGLMIEDAFGGHGDAHITVTGNTFQNISPADGAISFQRFTDGSNTADFNRLSDVRIQDNTFTTVTQDTYLNPTYFGAGAVLSSTFTGAQVIIGTSGADTVTDTSTGLMTITTGPGSDSIDPGIGNDAVFGGSGTDTVTYGAGYHLAIQSGHWVAINGGETDTLSGVEKVVIGSTTYLLVDQLGTNVGGFQHVQDAIDFASGGEQILIAPGSYSESAVPTEASGTAGGLYINKPNLTLQGVDANGVAITTASAAQSTGATIIAGNQADFSAQHFVGVAATGLTIQGLHLQTGAGESGGKLLEVWANNATIKNDFLDVNIGGTDYSYSVAVYFNDNGTTASDNITAYTVGHNILNEGIILANGVGDPSFGIGANQQITGNQFVGHFNDITGEGRYDTVVVNGQVNGIGWLLEPTQTPTISGNSFGDNSTPFLLRGSDNNTANFPTATQVQHILDTNGDANTHYTYVVTSGGDLETATRAGGAYHSFAVTNTIDTLNFALDTTVDASDPVFGDQRIYMQSGDTVIIQSGVTGTLNSQVMVEGLNIKATANSADLNLTLATQFADHSAIAGGGVHNVTLVDYAAGQGAAVDVTGNGLDNTIVGNSGANTLQGGGGADNIVGNGGSDTLLGDDGNDTLNGGVNDFGITPAAASDILNGGTGNDTFVFDGRFGDDTITDWTDNVNGTDGEDIVLVNYAGQTPIISDLGNGNAIITINDGSVDSSITVEHTAAIQLHVINSGLDIIIH